MEAVPRLPMLSFDLKSSTENPSFGSKLKHYIRDFYNEDPEMYSNEIHTLEGLRAQAVCAVRSVSGCQALKRYYCQLHFLQSRFPMAKDGAAAVPFTWQDTYTSMVCTLADIRFEMVCILYNIGALHSQLGASDSRVSADGMKMCCTHFQCAAWAFQHLKDTYPQPAGVDLAPNVMQFMYHLTLAQAQECILEKSMMDNRKATIIAKVAVQIVDYYNLAMNTLEQSGSEDCSVADTVGSKLYKNWRRYVKFKIVHHSAVSLLYQGQQAEEQQKMGERVAFYQAASEKLKEAMKLSKGLDEIEAVNEALAFTMDVIEGKKKAAKNENEFIYHEEVPDKDSLPDVKGASLVKGIPFNVNDPEISGPDIFSRLVPMKAHEASSLYSEEKAKLRRRIGLMIDEKDQQLVGFMNSLQLEQLNSQVDSDMLPQDLVDRCAALSAKPNAIQDLIESMNKLADTYHDVEGMLQDIKELLELEESREKEYQDVMGNRPPSIVATDLTREANKYQEAHSKASESNQTLHKAMTLHISNLRILSNPLAELQKQIPTVSIVNSPASEASIKEMKHLVGKVDEMKTQRAMLANSLRTSTSSDDITSQLVTRSQESLDAIFQQEMQKHERIVATIEQNLAAQDNILKALTEAYARYAPTRKAVSEIIRNRDTTISALISSYDAYEDLLAKSGKGLEFYRKLETNVTKLLQRVKGTCKVQEEEREQILVKNHKTLPSAKAPKAPIDNTSVELTSQSKGKGGPKLKDYLASMKIGGAAVPVRGYPSAGVDASPYYNVGYGQIPPAASPLPTAYYDQTAPMPSDQSYQWVPSIRPAPVGSEGTGEQGACGYSGENAASNPKMDSSKIAPQHYGYSHPTQNGKSNYSQSYLGHNNSASVPFNYNAAYSLSSTPASQTYAPGYPATAMSTGQNYTNQYPLQYQSASGHTEYTGSNQATGYSQSAAYATPGQASNAATSGHSVAGQSTGYSGTDQATGYGAQTGTGYMGGVGSANVYQYQGPVSYASSTGSVDAYGSSSATQQQTYPSQQQQPYPNQSAQQPTYPTQTLQQQTYPTQPHHQTTYTIQTSQQQQNYPPHYGSSLQSQVGATSYPSSQAYPTASTPQPQSAVVSQTSTALQQPVGSTNAQASYTNHPGYSYNASTGQYEYSSGYQTSAGGYPGQQSQNFVKSHTTTGVQDQSALWSQQSNSNSHSYNGPSTSQSNPLDIARYGADFHAKSSGSNTSVSSSSSSEMSRPHQQYYGNVQQQYSYPVAISQQPPSMIPSSQSNPHGIPSTEYQYSASPADSRYTSAGSSSTSQTSSSQNTYEGQTYAAQYNAAQVASGNPSTVYSQGTYYSLPYGYQYNPDGSIGTPPASPQHALQDQQMTYMHARVQNPTSTTNSQMGSSLSSSSSLDQINAAKESSNIDLLAGLDFTVNQPPLTPQPSTTSASRKKDEQHSTNSPDSSTKQNGVANVIKKAPESAIIVESTQPDFKNTSAITALKEPSSTHEITTSSQLEVPIKVETPADSKLTLKDFGKDPYTDPDSLNQFVQEVEKYEKFVDGLTTKTLNGPTPLDMKWKELLDLQEKDANNHSISVARCYPMKNRFPDILPYDSTRVELPSTKDDYINASYMKNLTPLTPPFIITQAPLPSTYADFWTMMWEQQVEVIVCLLSDAELQDVYWPVEKVQELTVGRMKLTLQSSNIRAHWVERIVSVSVETRATRVIVHLQFTAWPGSSFPASPGPFLGFVTEALNYYCQQRGPNHPVVVHCLSGVGRTGLFCLITAALCEIQAGRGLLELIKTTGQMSVFRKGSLRDREHLKFAYQAMLYYAQDMLMKIATNKTERNVLDAETASQRRSFLDQSSSMCSSVCSSGRSSPCYSLVDLSRFSFKQETSTRGRKRFTKESFTSSRRSSLSSLECLDKSDDPLSQLDPLWRMK